MLIMFFKKEIQEAVYDLYLNSVDVLSISECLDLQINDVNDIIDYLNSLL